ncbi:MAG: GDYXXLXY domain-containing protein [Burkholderiales bacterium]|nr:GDYXXLXY domain-containing protein [Burkholderiales bacterium]
MTRVQGGAMAAGLVLVLAAVNLSVRQKEALVATGTPVLLRLAPVDPRSLMQGDYMRLDYALLRDLPPEIEAGPRTMTVRLTLDAAGVATRLAPAEGAQPAAGEAHMIVRRVGERRWRLGSDAWFFQEGTAEVYAGARYGEYRTDAAGESVLVGLRDEHRARLGPDRFAHRWQVPAPR